MRASRGDASQFLQRASDVRRISSRIAPIESGTARALDAHMAGVRDRRELVLYNLCEEVRIGVRRLASRRAFDRSPKLRRQLQSSSEHPSENVVDGFARCEPAVMARFLRVAKASQTETIEHVFRASAYGYITDDEAEEVAAIARHARAALTQFVRSLEGAPRRSRSARETTDRI